MNRALVIAAAIGAVLLGGQTAAQAAPGDPLTFDDVPAGCYVIGLPPSQRVFCPEPRDPNAPPPLYSICTPIEPIGELPRKSCQQYVRETNAPVGAPQVFVYPPEDGGLTPPPAPVDRPAPAATAPAVPVASAPARVVPAAPAVVAPASTPADPEPTVAPTPAADPAAPVAEPATPSNTPGVEASASLADKIDSWVPWAAVVSCAVLLMCLVRKPSKKAPPAPLRNRHEA